MKNTKYTVTVEIRTTYTLNVEAQNEDQVRKQLQQLDHDEIAERGVLDNGEFDILDVTPDYGKEFNR